MGSGPAIASISIGTKTIQKLRFRILPYLFLLYVISYLDRINIGFAAGLTPFYVPVLMRVGWFCDRTWGGRSVAESGPSSAANSAGVLYPIPLCNLS